MLTEKQKKTKTRGGIAIKTAIVLDYSKKSPNSDINFSIVGVIGPENEEKLKEIIKKVGTEYPHYEFIVVNATAFMVLDREGEPVLDKKTG